MALIETKWPLLLAAGKPVTPEQADDILIRTCGGYFISNDKPFETGIAQVLGIMATDGNGAVRPEISWKAGAAWYESVGGLELHYLGNRRIVSSWIGGPHGWCDWDGTIGCGSHNIGKWPSVGEVEDDLAAIAAAWPFLDMRVQLVDGEGEGPLCGEWRVLDGKMLETEPGPPIEPAPLDDLDILARMTYAGERGVDLSRLASANARVKAAR